MHLPHTHTHKHTYLQFIVQRYIYFLFSVSLMPLLLFLFYMWTKHVYYIRIQLLALCLFSASFLYFCTLRDVEHDMPWFFFCTLHYFPLFWLFRVRAFAFSSAGKFWGHFRKLFSETIFGNHFRKAFSETILGNHFRKGIEVFWVHLNGIWTFLGQNLLDIRIQMEWHSSEMGCFFNKLGVVAHQTYVEIHRFRECRLAICSVFALIVHGDVIFGSNLCLTKSQHSSGLVPQHWLCLFLLRISSTFNIGVNFNYIQHLTG